MSRRETSLGRRYVPTPLTIPRPPLVAEINHSPPPLRYAASLCHLASLTRSLGGSVG